MAVRVTLHCRRIIAKPPLHLGAITITSTVTYRYATVTPPLRRRYIAVTWSPEAKSTEMPIEPTVTPLLRRRYIAVTWSPEAKSTEMPIEPSFMKAVLA